MKHAVKFLAAGAAAMIGGMAVAGTGTATGSKQDGPVRCEIRAESKGSAMRLSGIVRTDMPVSGTYRFDIASGGRAGSAKISQGGAFAAEPGGDFELSQVLVANRGAVHDAELELRIGGKTYACDARLGPI